MTFDTLCKFRCVLNCVCVRVNECVCVCVRVFVRRCLSAALDDAQHVLQLLAHPTVRPLTHLFLSLSTWRS